MVLSIQIAECKFHQYQPRAISPNSMFAKLPTLSYIETAQKSHFFFGAVLSNES